MDDNDPMKRINELERQLAEEKTAGSPTRGLSRVERRHNLDGEQLIGGLSG